MRSSVDLNSQRRFSHHPGERDSLLVSPDFSESDGTGPVPVWLLDTTGSGTTRLGSGLSGSLGSDWKCQHGIINDSDIDHDRVLIGLIIHSRRDLRCFRGAFPPVDFRAVCLVRAIVSGYVSWSSYEGCIDSGEEGRKGWVGRVEERKVLIRDRRGLVVVMR